MPKKWSDVAASPTFRALSADEQDEARRQYFDSVIVPQVDSADVEVARSQFLAETAPPTPNVKTPNFSQAMPRAEYERAFDLSNPGASAAGRQFAMAEYDAQQARAPKAPVGPAKPPTPEEFFDTRLNEKLAGKQKGVVPALPKRMDKLQTVPTPTAEASTGAVLGESLKAGTVNVLSSIARAPAAVLRATDGVLASLNEVGRMAGVPEWALDRKFVHPLQLLNPLVQGAEVGGLHIAGTNDVATAIKQVGARIENENHARVVEQVSARANEALDRALATGDTQPLQDVLSDPKAWASAFGQAAPSLVAAALGGVPAMAALEGGAAEDAIRTFEEQGGEVSKIDGASAVIQQTAVNTLLEKLGLDAMLGKLPASMRSQLLGASMDGLKGNLTRAGTGAVVGGLGEAGTEGLQTVNENLAKRNYDADQSLTDGVLMGMMGGAGAGSGVGTITGAVSKAQPTVANFTPADSLSAEMGLSPIVVPLTGRGEQNVSTDSAAGRLAAGSGGPAGGDVGGGVAGAGLQPIGPVGDLGDGSQGIGPGDAADLPAGTGAREPAADLSRVAARASDQDLLGRVHGALASASTEPVSVMMARSGAGYGTEQDAAVAQQVGRKREPDLDWRVEPIDGGRFRVAAYRAKVDPIVGEKIDDTWTAFSPESGSLGIPRAEMPQIEAAHRGAMTSFLRARGIDSEQQVVPADSLKPTQAEFAPAKVEKAKSHTGGDRSILVSADNHVLDGHHQWLAKKEAGEDVKVIRLAAPIARLLETVKQFPSAANSDGATQEPIDGDTRATDPASPAMANSAAADPAGAPAVPAAPAGLPVEADAGSQPGPAAGTAPVDSAPAARPADLRLALPAPKPIADRAMRALTLSGRGEAEVARPTTDAQYAASAIGRILGRKVTFFRSTKAGAGAVPNAFKVPGDDAHIYVDASSDDAPMKLVFHEAVHTLSAEQKGVLIKELGATFDQSKRSDFTAEFGYGKHPEAMIDEEIAAFITQAVSGRQDFLEQFNAKLKNKEFRAAVEVLLQNLKAIVTRVQASSSYGDAFIEKYVTDVQRAIDVVSTTMATQANSVPSNTPAPLAEVSRPVWSTKRGKPAPTADKALVLNDLGAAKALAGYLAAKAGDEDAAFTVAEALLPEEALRQIIDLVGDRDPIIQPVLAEEAAGRNAIPLAAAARIAGSKGWAHGTAIVQATAPKRTSMPGLERAFMRPVFDGAVEQGRDYVLVDDTLTQGGTFAALKQHIEAGGGRVIAAVALTGKQYSSTLALSNETLSKLRDAHGSVEEQFRAQTGYGFDALTESEARYLAGYRPADAVRDRITSGALPRDGRPTAEAATTTPEVKPSNRADPLSGIPLAYLRKIKVPSDPAGDPDAPDLPADQALAGVREEIDDMRALLRCMRG